MVQDHKTNKDKYKEIVRYSKEIYEEISGDDTNIDISKSFPYAALKLFFDLKDDDISEALYSLKSIDDGLDAFFVDGSTIHICQFKTKQSVSTEPFEKNDLSHFELIEGRLNDPNKYPNKRINEIKAEYREMIQDKNVVVEKHFFYVSFCDNITEGKYNFKTYTAEDIIDKIETKTSMEKETNPEYCEIEFVDPENNNDQNKSSLYYYTPRQDRKTCLGLISGKEIINLFNKHKHQLFDRNVRYFLEKTRVNEDIIETALNNPKDFYYYNNGITITCEEFNKVGGMKLRLKSPQIINGAQTVNSIYNAHKNDKDKSIEYFEDIKLLAIVIQSTKDDQSKFQTNLTKYRNSNNPIRLSDYKGNDPIQEKLQQTFYDMGYFYEIKRGEGKIYLKPNKNGKEDKHNVIKDYKYKDILKTNHIKMEELIEIYCAYYLQNPTIAKNNKKDVFKDDNYNKMFPKDRQNLKDKVKVMIFAWKIYNKLSQIGRSGTKFFDSNNSNKNKEYPIISTIYNKPQREILEKFMNNKDVCTIDDLNIIKEIMEFLSYSKYHILASIAEIIRINKINITQYDYSNSASAIVETVIQKWIKVIIDEVIAVVYNDSQQKKDGLSFVNYSKKPIFWQNIKEKINKLRDSVYNEFKL